MTLRDLMPEVVDLAARKLIEAVTLTKDDLPTDTNATTVEIIDDTLHHYDLAMAVRLKVREILNVKKVM